MSGAASTADEALGARSARVLFVLAAIAVALAAADTYVVVLALPDMMASTGLPIDQLHRATPIISSFLLGHVATMPLAGRLADLQGRYPVLVLALVVFAIGSLVTVLAYDVNSMVVGRFLQGAGAGGLVPVTLALVADLYPADRRSVPLGVVSGAQETAQVVGPLLGAVVLTVADWRALFALNMAVALALAATLRMARARRLDLTDARATASLPPPCGSPDLLGLTLGLVAVVAAALVFLRPAAVMRDLIWSQIFIPFVGDGRWLSPLGVVAMAAAALFVVRLLLAPRPLIDVRPWLRAALSADLVGSAFLTVALGGVVLASTTVDPVTHLLPDDGQWYLFGAILGAVCLVIHLRRTAQPLIPRGVLRLPPVWGALLVSFLAGAALISVLVRVPLFARATVHGEAPLMAALVLLQLVVSLPVGAWGGGHLTRWWGPGPTTALGMVAASGTFASMSQWQISALEHWPSSVTLVVCGLGFGLAAASVNAAVVDATAPSLHSLNSSSVVLARTVGMLVGAATLAGTAQQSTAFTGAAVLCSVAALTAIVMFRTATPARARVNSGLGCKHD